jgi:hypothetical protein
MMRTLLLALCGCMPSVVPDKNSPLGALDDTASGSGEMSLAVLSTIASDYSVGSLAVVHLDTLGLEDTLAPTSGDAVVRGLEDTVVVLNRLNTDTLRLYTPGAWVAPDLELALPDLSNPQDAVWCGERLWVSLHNADHLPAYDATGRRVAKADLSPWAGSDGSAEASGMVRVGERVVVALQQLAQDGGWTSEGGAIVAVDCETTEVQTLLEAPLSPSLVPGPKDGLLLVRTGLYGELDGAVVALEVETGEVETLLTEAEVGMDITDVASSSEDVVFLTATTEWTFGVHCLSLQTGSWQTGLVTSSYLSEVAMDDRGRAWVSVREGWGPEAALEPGLILFDAATCAPVLEDGASIKPTLAPFNVSFL